MSVRVKLDNKERGYYASLYQAVDATNTGQIGGAQAVAFFKRSGLSIEILKKIWLMSSPNNQTLNKEEFYVALKLISYAQNNIDVSTDSILRCIPSPLPQFQSDNEEVYKLRPEQERLYQNYIQQLDYSNSTVSTQLAMNLFSKTPLTQFQLQNILNIVDPTIQSKPRISSHTYIIIAHLISLASQQVTIPNKLPQSLQDYINSQVIPAAIPQTVPKSNDLLDFEANFDKSKSPIAKYSAFNTLDIPQTAQETPQQIQTPTSQLTASQSFKIQPTQQLQKPNLKQQNSIDIMTQEIEQQSIIISQQQQQQSLQQTQIQQQQQQIQSQQIQQQQIQQIQQQQQQGQQQPRKSLDLQKQTLLTEQLLIQQQQLESNYKEANELLTDFKEQHEKLLISTQSQLESLQTTNEQYKTLLKKISDENNLFQEELKQVDQKKKQLTEQLSKQAVEINSKLGLNIQIKQEYIKQSVSTVNTVNDYANQIIGELKSTYEIEQERKKRQDQEIMKEIKSQKEFMNQVLESLSNLSKEMKSQRKNSTPYQHVDTHEPYPQPTIIPQQTKQQIHSQSKSLFDQQIIIEFEESAPVINLDKQNILFSPLPQQQQIQQQQPQQPLQQQPLQQQQNPLIVQEQKNDLLLLSDKKEEFASIQQPLEIQQQQQLKFDDINFNEHFETAAEQSQVQFDVPIIEEKQTVEIVTYDIQVASSPIKKQDEQEKEEHKNDVGFDDAFQFQKQEEPVKDQEIKIQEEQAFGFKFETDFHQQVQQRDSIDIEQNPSINFEQNFQGFNFQNSLKANDDVQIEFDANKEFGGGDWGFNDGFTKTSPQKQDEFQGFKW